MKKIVAMTAIVTLVPVPVLVAEQDRFTGPSSTTRVSSTAQAGGFTGSSGVVAAVANAKSLRDDTWVTLRGEITKRTSDDLYRFQSASGVINVDVDHERWNSVAIGPQDIIEIQGEIDKNWDSIEIDVKRTRKAAPQVLIK